MNANTSTPCPHCGTKVGGPPGTYCCAGCEGAARLLSELSLEGWYADREAPAPRVESVPALAWDALPLHRRPDGSAELVLQVDGLRCASCVGLCEAILEATDGVREATVSHATGRARVRFDPERSTPAALAGRLAAVGYRPRPPGSTVDPTERDLLLRLGVAAFGAANVMGASAALYVGWFDGIDERFAQLLRWTALLAATPVATWSAAPFHLGAWRGFKTGTPSMDLPVSLAVIVLWAHGIASTAAHREGWLDSLTMLVALLLVGRVLEARGRRRTAEAASMLAAELPGEARRWVNGTMEVVATRALRPGDTVEWVAGDVLAADGVVLEGHGLVRMALWTGESDAVPVGPGASLPAGASLEDGRVLLEVSAVGERSHLGAVAEALALAGAAPRAPSAADRAAPFFLLATLGTSFGVGAALALAGAPDVGLTRAVAILVVACPCAFALARPLVGASGLGALARRGLLMRSVEAIEDLATVDVVCLDKTGTLTLGNPVVVEADEAVLREAAALARMSRHPMSRAIVAEAVRRDIPLGLAQQVEETPGLGLTGLVDGATRSLRRGQSGVALRGPEGLIGEIALADVPREGLPHDIAALYRTSVRVLLLTGDRPGPAQALAAAAGITEVHAAATPADKVACLRALHDAGHATLFVGDGLNDAEALTRATVGIAMADAAAPTLLAADGVLVAPTVRPLATAIRLARVVRAHIRRSLARSAGYNVLAVLAAAAGWIDPLVAAVLMPLSSGLVIASAASIERTAARQEAQ